MRMEDAAYIDVCDPPQSADNRGARDGVTGVQDDADGAYTCNCLRTSLLLERGRKGSEERLHGQRRYKHE